MLSVLIPIRDEYENLDRNESTFRENLKNMDFEVILVNDFSKDKSLEKAKEISSLNNNFKIFNNDQKGLGGAINLGIKKSTGDYICIMMADLSDDINDLKRYNDLIEKKNLDAVLGSRFLKNSKVRIFTCLFSRKCYLHLNIQSGQLSIISITNIRM